VTCTFGVFSAVSKKFCFGIRESSKEKAMDKLIQKVGYWNSRKYRWIIKPIPKKEAPK